MSDKKRGEAHLASQGVTPELAEALKAVVVRIAGRRFLSLAGLSRQMTREVWNPWNFEGGFHYVRAAINFALRDTATLERIGVAQIEQSSRIDRIRGRRNTRILLVESVPGSVQSSVNFPTREYRAVPRPVTDRPATPVPAPGPDMLDHNSVPVYVVTEGQ